MSPLSDEDLRAANESTHSDSPADCQKNRLCGDLGPALRIAWIVHILFRQRGKLPYLIHFSPFRNYF